MKRTTPALLALLALHLWPFAFPAAAAGPGPFAIAVQAPAARPMAIEINDQYAPHEPIVATVNSPATLYLWEWTDGVEGIEVADGRSLHVWAPPGKHRLKCVLLTIDWEKRSVSKAYLRAEFEVTDQKPPTPPEPIVNPYRPDPAFRKAVGPVSQIKLSRSDASRLARLFHQVGSDVQAGSVAGLKTYQGLADELRRRGVGLDLRGKYAGLAGAVDVALKAGLGEADRPIEVPRTVAFLETLAWGVWETGK